MRHQRLDAVAPSLFGLVESRIAGAEEGLWLAGHRVATDGYSHADRDRNQTFRRGNGGLFDRTAKPLALAQSASKAATGDNNEKLLSAMLDPFPNSCRQCTFDAETKPLEQRTS